MSFFDPKYRIVHYMDGYDQDYYAVQHWRFWFPFWRVVDCGYGYYTSTLTFDLEEDALKKKSDLEFCIEHKKKLSKKTVISYLY